MKYEWHDVSPGLGLFEGSESTSRQCWGSISTLRFYLLYWLTLRFVSWVAHETT